MTVIDRMKNNEIWVVQRYGERDGDATREILRLATQGEKMEIQAAKCKLTYTENDCDECEYEGCLAQELCWGKP